MAIFEDITLGFDGEEYVVKHTQMMKLIAIIEDIITLQELINKDSVKLSKLANAYAAALNFAGAKATVEDVYASLFGEGGASHVSEVITTLIMMMLPPSSYRPPEAEATTAKKKKAAK